jgi:hypothetical protein
VRASPRKPGRKPHRQVAGIEPERHVGRKEEPAHEPNVVRCAARQDDLLEPDVVLERHGGVPPHDRARRPGSSGRAAGRDGAGTTLPPGLRRTKLGPFTLAGAIASLKVALTAGPRVTLVAPPWAKHPVG